MKALVTGGTGFVGSHVVRALQDDGHGVRVLARPDGDRRALTGVDVEIVDGTLEEPRALSASVHGCDVVFHVAGVFTYWGSEDAMLRTMVDGTERVVDACADAGVQRMVLTSSSVTLGSNAKSVPRDDWELLGDEPAPPYFRIKLAQERAAIERAALRGLPLVVVNPTVTVGSHDYKLVPSNATIVHYLQDPWRTTFPGGCNVVSVADVARGHVIVAERGKPGVRYVLGSENLEWSLIHRTISELCNLRGPYFIANHTMSYLIAVASEVYAAALDREPSVTRDQAAMVGRFYWYRHAPAAQLGYAPRPARQALAEATAWLLTSPHLRSIAGAIRPSRELRRARNAVA